MLLARRSSLLTHRRLLISSQRLCSSLPAQIKAETEKLHQEVLSPINARLHGPLERRPFTEGVPLPIVLLLGNHSAGKSSFINHVLRFVDDAGGSGARQETMMMMLKEALCDLPMPDDSEEDLGKSS